MKKRKHDKIHWQKRVDRALKWDLFWSEGYPFFDGNRIALKYVHYALNIQKSVLPLYHPDFLKTYNRLCRLYDYECLDKPIRQLKVLFKILEIRERYFKKEYKELINVYSTISSIFQYTLNNTERANLYRKKNIGVRLSSIDTLHSSWQVSIDYGEIANIYHKLEDFEKRNKYLFKKIEVLEKFLHEKPTHFTGSIARVYEAMGNYEKAVEYNLKSIDFGLKNHDKLLATTYDSIAENYRNLKNYDKSLEYHFKSIENMIELKGDKRGELHFLRIFHYRTALTYFEMKDLENARNHALKSVEIANVYNGLKYQETDELSEQIKLKETELQ